MSLAVRKRFACDPSSAGSARAFVVDAVRGFDVDLDAVKSLVSELATNAIVHAQTSFEVSVRQTGSGIRVEVSDESVAMPAPGPRTDEGGFGLLILGALAQSWGVSKTDDGKVVWFEVPARTPAEEEIEEHEPPAPTGPVSEQPTYSIGAVSQIVGVGASTLRAWEQRYGVVVPFRSAGRHRLFSRDQIDKLRFVVAQVEAGVTAADAHRVLQQRIEEVTFVPATPGPSMLVLVAERDHYAAELSEYFLRTEGFDVRVALDGEEAVRLQGQRRPDVVILEALLPGGSAIELCTQLTAAAIPVLVVSSLDMRETAVEAGASAFLLKPLDPLQLVSTVRDLIGTSALASAAPDSTHRALSTHQR